MIWLGGTVCASTLSSVSPMKWALLQVGMMIVTLEGRITGRRTWSIPEVESQQLPAERRQVGWRPQFAWVEAEARGTDAPFPLSDPLPPKLFVHLDLGIVDGVLVGYFVPRRRAQNVLGEPRATA